MTRQTRTNPRWRSRIRRRLLRWVERMIVSAPVRRTGLRTAELRAGTVVVSSSGFRVTPVADDAWLVTGTRDHAAPRLLPLTEDACVLSATRNPTRMRTVPLTGEAWVVTGRQSRTSGVDVAPLGTAGWLVAKRPTSPRAALGLETQTAKHLGARHVAWLLDQYQVDLVIDVGANLGQFAGELRQHGYTGHIASFEPVPDFTEVLIELAADDPRWSVHSMALGVTDGTLPVRVQHSLSSALESTEYGRGRFASLRQFAEAEPIEVPLRRLDGLLDELLAPLAADGIENPRIFLKTDTQGYDLEVFEGLGDRITDIVGLQSEVALLLIYEGMPRMPRAIATYEAAGFEITGLFPVTREADARVIEYDCVMVRASAFPGRTTASG